MAELSGNSNANGTAGRQQPSSGRIKRKAKTSVPMTAMIDVTFLLLTYFLLTTTFRQNEGQLPGSLPGPNIIPTLVENVSVQVRAVGDNCQNAVYSLVGENTLLRSPQELVESLRARRERTGRDAIVVIKPGRAVRWRYVVEACNQATVADFQTTISQI
jgi:biopolymer transport protein ExbD